MDKTYAAEITWTENDFGDRWYGRIMGAEDVLAFQACVSDASAHRWAVYGTAPDLVGDAAYMQITKMPSATHYRALGGRFRAVFQARSRYARQTRYYATLTEAQEAVTKWGSRKFRKAL